MEYINVRGLDKPVPRLIFGTAWFSLDAEAEAHKMMDLYVERGGTILGYEVLHLVTGREVCNQFVEFHVGFSYRP